MIKLLRTASTKFDKVKRLVVTVWNGKSDVLSAEEAGPFGMDSNPLKDMIALYAKTGRDGDEVIIGYLNKNRLADVGETRLYATDSAGTLKTFVWLKNDGMILLGGDQNYAVLFNELKTEFNKLKADYNDLVTKVNANATLLGTHVHPYLNIAVPAFTSASGVAGQMGSANTSNIDNAKNAKIKTNG